MQYYMHLAINKCNQILAQNSLYGSGKQNSPIELFINNLPTPLIKEPSSLETTFY